MSDPHPSFSAPSPAAKPHPVLRQEQFDALRSTIYAHLGMHFPDGASPCSRRVSPAG
ncbi:MAG: hypothetical protein QM783_05265 [Phycisphaerales bacterium]